jgi:hypothetical protein
VSNLTPQQVIETLSKISKDIDEATDDITEADLEAVHARVAHKKNYARFFLETQGSMDVKRYTADLETADTTMLASELADQKHRAAVSQIRTLRDRLEVGRSLGPLIRLEWGQS